MDFCSLNNYSKKNHLNVVLLSINHSSRKNYVAAQFSSLQGEKNPMVVYVFFSLHENRVATRFSSLAIRFSLMSRQKKT